MATSSHLSLRPLLGQNRPIFRSICRPVRCAADRQALFNRIAPVYDNVRLLYAHLFNWIAVLQALQRLGIYYFTIFGNGFVLFCSWMICWVWGSIGFGNVWLFPGVGKLNSCYPLSPLRVCIIFLCVICLGRKRETMC